MGSQPGHPEPKFHRAICQCIFICYCIAYTKWGKRTRTCTRYVHNLGFQSPWAPRPGDQDTQTHPSEVGVHGDDMQKIIIYLLQCEKKSMWQNLTSPSMDSLTEQMGSQWALSMATSEPKLQHAEPGLSKCYFICHFRKEKAYIYKYKISNRNMGFQSPWAPNPGDQHSQTPLSEVGVRGDDVWHAKNSHLPIAMREKIDVTKFDISELGFAYRTNGLPMGSQHGHLGAQMPTRRSKSYFIFYCIDFKKWEKR